MIYTPHEVFTHQPRTVILTPLIMLFPNRHCIYSPHPNRPRKRISFSEFSRKYGKYPTQMRVCLTQTNDSNEIYQQSQQTTAVGYGLDGWFIITGMDD